MSPLLSVPVPSVCDDIPGLPASFRKGDYKVAPSRWFFPGAGIMQLIELTEHTWTVDPLENTVAVAVIKPPPGIRPCGAVITVDITKALEFGPHEILHRQGRFTRKRFTKMQIPFSLNDCRSSGEKIGVVKIQPFFYERFTSWTGSQVSIFSSTTSFCRKIKTTMPQFTPK